ncbi:MAG TPA: hypothetical protein O0X23_02250 [Methanocorpusculum sp.]|nr:hypothetical protein [Methanocorpusculum sp.]
MTAPAVSADAPREYYELHDMCLCEESEDLGKIPFATFGIGYSARVIDSQNDKWEIFIHAGTDTKNIIITPETPMSTLVTLRDFVNSVDECKTESDQVPANLALAIGSGIYGSIKLVKGVLTDDALSEMLGASGIAASATEIHQFVIHFNNAKTAQKNAETLFGVLQ